MSIISTNIDISQLHNHPKNVRQAYNEADLEELAGSIRVMGILQNLTVIPEPGHEESLDSFWVVIGNRRLKAAQMAGLRRLPCRIVFEMDEQTQITTMMQENMQRKDLTPHEEGQGFQLMLDLGITEDEISRKTGISKATVRHRIEIAKLDTEMVNKRLCSEYTAKLKGDCVESTYYQLTLSDLAKLEKVDSIEARNEILETARSSEGIAYKVREYNRIKSAREFIAKIEELCKYVGIKKGEKNATPWDLGNITIKSWSFMTAIPKVPDIAELKGLLKGRDADLVRYLVSEKSPGFFIVTTEKPKAVKTENEYDKKNKLREKNRKILDAAYKDLKARIRMCVVDIVNGKLTRSEPMNAVIMETYEGCWNILAPMKYTNVNRGRSAAYYYGAENEYEVDNRAIEKVKGMPAVWQELLSVGFEVNKIYRFFGWENNYDPENDDLQTILRMINMLSKWGFCTTDEDDRLLGGKHPAYKQKADGDA